MTELKDLKVGDEVTVTLTGKVIEKEDGDGFFQTYVNIDYSKASDWLGLDDDDIKAGVVIDRASRPLPTENGMYVASHLIKDGYSLDQAAVVKISGGKWWGETGNFDTAEEYAKYLFEQYGLTRVHLVPER